MWKGLARKIDSYIFCGSFTMAAANRTIELRLRAARDLKDGKYDKEIEEIEKQLTGLTREQAIAFFESTEDRQKRVEDKAKVGLLGITVAVATFGLGAKLTIEAKYDLEMVIFLTSILVLAVMHLGAGGHLALKALLIREKFDVTPEQALQGNESAMASYIWARNQNEDALRIRTNLTTVGLRLAARGVVLALVFILVGVEVHMLSLFAAPTG